MAVQKQAVSFGIGAQLGSYEIVSHHGSGGMADIWVARKTDPVEETPPGGRFAIKTLLKRRAHHPEYVDRFAQEGELHGRLDHPSIVRLLETGGVKATRYLALEFIEGLNLRQMIHAAQPRRVPLSLAFAVMAEVCEALQYLHDFAGVDGAMGLVHGDVSPENVMIGLDGRVKLIDFGLATATLAPVSSRPSAAALETSVVRPGRHVPPARLQYLAPERIHGGMLDRRSDIYAVGAMLFELVHGKLPFHADVTYELLTRICQGTTVAGDSTLDPVARGIIEQAMAVLPEERLETAKQMSEKLRAFGDVVDTTHESVGSFVRRLVGLEEVEEEEEIDLMWTEEEAPTAQRSCLESPCDTPLLEEGTELDVQIRELLREMAQPSPDAEAVSKAGVEVEVEAEAEAEPESLGESSDETVEPTASDGPAPARTDIADLFAATPRREPPATDLFGVYTRRSAPPSRETFLTPSSTPLARETFLTPSSTPLPREAFLTPSSTPLSRDTFSTPSSSPPPKRSVVPSRFQSSHAAAAHFDAGWHLLREGKAAETLTEWEAAMALDPDNRSYAVNVQKLRTKLQR
ncbi:MAG TPA: serine/threonine-protein kinase [Polyangiaceae bacterium]|nr:serine/threonine-protein kinase [Polyangiaceae bacterium]